MTNASMTKKLTITVSADFYEGLVRSAGPRKVGAFIEKHLSPLVASKTNLDAGYRAMASDTEREQQATEWCSALTGKTLKNEAW